MNKLIITSIATIILWVWALTSHAQNFPANNEGRPTVEVYNFFGKQDDSTWKNQATRILVYNTNGINWLCIGRFDYTPPKLKGFNDGYTYVSTRYKPIVTEYPNHVWVITFGAELEKF